MALVELEGSRPRRIRVKFIRRTEYINTVATMHVIKIALLVFKIVFWEEETFLHEHRKVNSNSGPPLDPGSVLKSDFSTAFRSNSSRASSFKANPITRFGPRPSGLGPSFCSAYKLESPKGQDSDLNEARANIEGHEVIRAGRRAPRCRRRRVRTHLSPPSAIKR
ncbi:hypothetical protein EVAR_65554_1 [Eumeta japonica]|uniref:Uncharacterized protein n=1 Tax=Eumeta variegata TaxID=151549 RepID=A0A4C1ZCG3_EUMVA|nr:hypothetical protein EVAR_65554_1 [Eumeta japonica]